ncbi:MAG: Slp family lipoprotein [Desulfobacterales bacterium]|nr:Slp family lipoprotein [Desulfobacterales bacterium]
MRVLSDNRSNGCKIVLFLLLLLTYGGLAGCAPALSRQFRQQVGPPVPFQELLKETEALKCERVVLGGYILETVNEPSGSLLTILQAPLDSKNEPKSQDLSEGRFLVRTEKFLDPEIYSKGRKLTVGGKVSGVLPQPLGNRLYRYPVIEAEELHLWPKEARYIRLYDPYYYDWRYPWHHYPYHAYPWWAW